MRRIIAIVMTLLVVSCAPYRYPVLADELYHGLHEYMEDNVIYDCKTDNGSIWYCVYTETEYGFMFDFLDSSMSSVFVVARNLTITSHGSLKLHHVTVCIDGIEHTVRY